jgi:hypothetical protein
MPSRLYSLLVNLGAVALVVGAILFIVRIIGDASIPTTTSAPTTTEIAAATEPFTTAAPSTTVSITGTTTSVTVASSPVKKPVKASVTKSTQSISSTAAAAPAQSPATSSSPQVTRIQDPYNFPAESFSTVNTDARSALVNILCMPRGGGSLAPISGSGVIIDPRGVILTNAHVAQYVLLSEDADINLSCQIRTGAPASAAWTANVLYIPPVWVSAHVSEINTAHPTGTGAHDYALLLINASISGSNLPAAFPYLPFDTREAVGFLGDQVLGASYPAEFLGGIAAENDLSPVSSVGPISQLLTLGTDTVDVISLGGVIEAQSGSSGGPVVNQWGRLVGIIATTSDAPTTAGRDLRAITMSYITRDIQIQTGSDLATFLSGDLSAKEDAFNTDTAPGLLKQYIQLLSQ